MYLVKAEVIQFRLVWRRADELITMLWRGESVEMQPTASTPPSRLLPHTILSKADNGGPPISISPSLDLMIKPPPYLAGVRFSEELDNLDSVFLIAIDPENWSTAKIHQSRYRMLLPREKIGSMTVRVHKLQPANYLLRDISTDVDNRLERLLLSCRNLWAARRLPENASAHGRSAAVHRLRATTKCLNSRSAWSGPPTPPGTWLKATSTMCMSISVVVT